MPNLEVIPLGVGDAFSALYYSFCLAVGYDGEWILVDCPHPIRKMMLEATATSGVSLDVPDISAVVQTHLHADHASGLEGFGFFKHFVSNERAKLVIHEHTQQGLWSGHLRAGMCQLIDATTHEVRQYELEDYFEITHLNTDAAITVGPFTIHCRQTIHHIPTFALRIQAGGASLGVSADTAFDPSLITWLSKADRIIHETNFGAHTPYEKLAALPEEVRNKMWLIHYPDSFDLNGSVIEPMIQGQRYIVSKQLGAEKCG